MHEATHARVSAAEAASVLRDIVDGRRTLEPSDARRSWTQVAVGEVGYRAGDARCVFFADHASLDHLVTIVVSDGRRGAFADWLARDGTNPLDLLEASEREALEQLLLTAG